MSLKIIGKTSFLLGFVLSIGENYLSMQKFSTKIPQALKEK
jgi:hypothetical protein